MASWSNDGQRIAIMHQISNVLELPQTSLEILDADFNTLWTETITLPGDEGFNQGFAYLNWSTDDRLLALSSLAWSTLTGNDPRSYLIVDVHTHKVFLNGGYRNVFFMGSRVLAGWYEGTDSSHIETMQVDLQSDYVGLGYQTKIVGLSGFDIPVAASSNPARLVVWKSNKLINLPPFTGSCSIFDDEGHLLAEMPEIFESGNSFCLTRSSETE